MTTKQRLAVLTSAIKQLNAYMTVLEERVEKLERTYEDELTGGVDGLDAEVHVRFLTPQEHAWAKLQRAGNTTRTPAPQWGAGGTDGP